MAARFQLPDGTVSTKPWRSEDAGQPLRTYTALPTDPVKLWKTQPSLRKVVEFVGDQVAQLPWHAYRRVSDTDRVRVQGSRAEQSLRAPGPFVTGAMLFRDLVIDMLMTDRFCAVVTGQQIVRLPPSTWTVRSDWLGRVTSVALLVPGGREIDLTDAPLIIGWGWSEHAAGGISPLITLAEILDESREAVAWRKRQWTDAPRFGSVLLHPTKFQTPAAREAFQRDWDGWLSGRTGTPILEGGLQLDRPEQLDPKSARDIEGRQLTDTEVAGAYHIPPELLGIRPGNFSNMQAFRSMLFGPTLGPLITLLEQAVNRVASHLDPSVDGLYLECSREAAINGSLVEQAGVLQTMTGGPIMTRAESRAKLNLPHLEGTDQLIVPLNVLVGGQASPTDSGSQNLDGADGPAQSFGGDTAEAAPATVKAQTDAAAIKQQLEALGLAFRAGVKPESAAATVGLPGLEFFEGIRPITVRVESDPEPNPVAPEGAE